MDKIDFRKKYNSLYAPAKDKFSLVEVPTLQFLKIDGQGDPNTDPSYTEAVGALYSMAYGLKFALKPSGLEYTVPPLEGLWWSFDMDDFTSGKKSEWNWTMMILQPEDVTPEIFEQIRQQTAKKKDSPSLSKIRLEPYNEGLSVQILYFGAYAEEGPTITRMYTWMEENGYEHAGLHHEIYLGDPRRTAPEKLKTVIRQPVKMRNQ